MQKNGSEILVECLLEQGVDTVFGYPGGSVLNIYDALYKYSDRITHVLTAHEQGAAHAADGYARATGRVGVCIATSGPGATNLVTGIATAYMDSIPMVAITGNVAVPLLGRDSFQEVDITGITMPVTKYNFIVKRVEEMCIRDRSMEWDGETISVKYAGLSFGVDPAAVPESALGKGLLDALDAGFRSGGEGQMTDKGLSVTGQSVNGQFEMLSDPQTGQLLSLKLSLIHISSPRGRTPMRWSGRPQSGCPRRWSAGRLTPPPKPLTRPSWPSWRLAGRSWCCLLYTSDQADERVHRL